MDEIASSDAETGARTTIQLLLGCALVLLVFHNAFGGPPLVPTEKSIHSRDRSLDTKKPLRSESAKAARRADSAHRYHGGHVARGEGRAFPWFAPTARQSWPSCQAASGHSLVAVMQTTDLRNGDDTTVAGGHDGPGHWCVSLKGEMTTRIEVVAKVGLQDAAKMPRTEHDQVISTLPPYGTDHSFAIWILPGAAL